MWGFWDGVVQGWFSLRDEGEPWLLTPWVRLTVSVVPVPRCHSTVVTWATAGGAQWQLLLWLSTAIWTPGRLHQVGLVPEKTAENTSGEICRCPRCWWRLLESSCLPPHHKKFLLAPSWSHFWDGMVTAWHFLILYVAILSFCAHPGFYVAILSFVPTQRKCSCFSIVLAVFERGVSTRGF